MSHSFPLHLLLSPRPCSSCAVHSSFGSLSSDSLLSFSDLANSPSFLSATCRLRSLPFPTSPDLFDPFHETRSLHFTLSAPNFTRVRSFFWSPRAGNLVCCSDTFNFSRLAFPGLDLIPRCQETHPESPKTKNFFSIDHRIIFFRHCTPNADNSLVTFPRPR